MYDAIVIGARCAGSPTAMLLGHKGYKVLLVDKGSFPSDVISTHFIHVAGVARLHRWGLLDRIVSSNCPPVREVTLDFGEVKLTGSAPPIDDIDVSYAPRRTVLDKILVDAAVESGAELKENFTVEDLIMDGERVVGVKGKSKNGLSMTERAPIVVGADGRNSFVARKVNAPVYNQTEPQCAVYYGYWSGLNLPHARLYLREGCANLLFATNDGLTVVVQCWSSRVLPNYREDVAGTFAKCLDLVPEVAEFVRQGKPESRIVGLPEMPSFFRKPFGPGWALVGDAGYYKNPLSAQGITDSLRDAELLANAIDAGLSGQQTMDAALADYEQTRNDIVMPIYQYTNDRGSLKIPPPEFIQLLMATSLSQEHTNRFVGLDAGTVPIPEFFSPENVQKIMESAHRATAV